MNRPCSNRLILSTMVLVLLSIAPIVSMYAQETSGDSPLVTRSTREGAPATNNPAVRSSPSGPDSISSRLLGSLSHDQVSLGLKQALTNGVQAAIRELGHEGGFLTNANFRIPLPKQLRYLEDALRSLKQDKAADDFVASILEPGRMPGYEVGEIDNRAALAERLQQ